MPYNLKVEATITPIINIYKKEFDRVAIEDEVEYEVGQILRRYGLSIVRGEVKLTGEIS